MMSGNEVVVANEEEVGEHEQVTIHYIKADGTPSTFSSSFCLKVSMNQSQSIYKKKRLEIVHC
jgi:hypothetical protein